MHPEEQISAYIDDELSEQDRQEVANHIELCPSCQRLFEALLVLQSNVSQTYRTLQAPNELDNLIFQAIKSNPMKKGEGRGWLSVPLISLIVLGLLWLMTGAVILNLLGGLLKFAFAIVYMVSHFIYSVPVLSGLTLVLSLIVLSVSGYSLKRLLQTTSS
jgi:predicted anti-sigma-YlaC factor YlaD